MSHIRTSSRTRYNLARLICEYVLGNHVSRIEASAQEIATYHHLPGASSRSISAFLNFLHSNHIRKAGFGFFVMGTAAFRKQDYPHRFMLELIEEARGLSLD